MANHRNKLALVLAWNLIGLGVVLLALYFAYLPNPVAFASAAVPDPGLILYSLATAGSALVAWGMMLGGVSADGISRRQVMVASAAGTGLLGLMRLGTALFPHAPFDIMRSVPVTEFLVFAVVAVLLYRNR